MSGLKIMRRRRFDDMLKSAALGAQVGDAEKILNILRTDQDTRELIARVARSAAKDHLEQAREDAREKFEGTPEFQQWARDQRERDLAQQVPAHTGIPLAPMMLRYGILGMLIEHGGQVQKAIIQAFPEAAPDSVRDALAKLLQEGLIELDHWHYRAVDWTVRLAALGIQKEAGHAHPDPQ